MQLCQKIKKECWWIYCDQIIKIENIGIGRKDSVKFIHFEIPGTFSICLNPSDFGSRKCICSIWTFLLFCLRVPLSLCEYSPTARVPSGWDPLTSVRMDAGLLCYQNLVIVIWVSLQMGSVITLYNWCTNTIWLSKQSLSTRSIE